METNPNSLTPIELIQLIVNPLIGSKTLRIVGNERSRELIQAIFFSNEEDPTSLVHEIIDGYEAKNEKLAGHAGIYAQAALDLYFEQLRQKAVPKNKECNEANGQSAHSLEP